MQRFPKFYNGSIFRDPFTDADFSSLVKRLAYALSTMQPFTREGLDWYVKPINDSYVVPDMKTFRILDGNLTTLNMGGVKGKYTTKVRFMHSGIILRHCHGFQEYISQLYLLYLSLSLSSELTYRVICSLHIPIIIMYAITLAVVKHTLYILLARLQSNSTWQPSHHSMHHKC